MRVCLPLVKMWPNEVFMAEPLCDEATSHSYERLARSVGSVSVCAAAVRFAEFRCCQESDVWCGAGRLVQQWGVSVRTNRRRRGIKRELWRRCPLFIGNGQVLEAAG